MWNFLDRHAEEALGAVLLALMTGIAFVNVVVRYCTTFSFAWSEELTVNLFVWVVLLGAARVFREGGHLSMTLLYKFCPRAARLCFYCLGAALGMAFFGALAFYGVLEVVDEYQLESIPRRWAFLCGGTLLPHRCFRCWSLCACCSVSSRTCGAARFSAGRVRDS